ncbi:hypothetical protein SLT67_07300 [Paenibacillus illinoisensis]|uniref:hypothetical protein n=1 Tax=Paenibacillus illinoisensis TaxID=59845 RepID=UPI003CEC68E8
MNLSELWKSYEADIRTQGFCPKTLKLELGNLDVTEITLTILREYSGKQAVHLMPNSLGHRIRFVHSLFRYAYEEMYLISNPSLKLNSLSIVIYYKKISV